MKFWASRGGPQPIRITGSQVGGRVAKILLSWFVIFDTSSTSEYSANSGSRNFRQKSMKYKPPRATATCFCRPWGGGMAPLGPHPRLLIRIDNIYHKWQYIPSYSNGYKYRKIIIVQKITWNSTLHLVSKTRFVYKQIEYGKSKVVMSSSKILPFA